MISRIVYSIVVLFLVAGLCFGTSPRLSGDGLDMNSHKITELTNGTDSQDAVSYSQLVSSRSTAFVTVGTSSINNYVIDGTADDVQLNAAIDAMATSDQGGVVLLTVANYAISANVTIHPFVTVASLQVPFSDGGWGDTKFDATEEQCARFIVTSTSVYPIVMEGASSLIGVQFWYPGQATNAAPTAYKPAITIEKPGALVPARVTISKVDFRNAYIAVQAIKYHGGITVTDCIGWPLYRGITEDNNADISYYDRVHFNPSFAGNPGVELSKWVYQHGIAFDVLGNDGSIISNCFSFGYNIGIQVHGTNSYQLSGCNVDASYTPLVIDSSNYVRFVGGGLVCYDWINSSYPSSIIATISSSNNCTLADSLLLGGRAGIALFGGSSNVVAGNNVRFNDAAAANGVGVYCTGSDCVIADNAFTADTTTSNGFQLVGADCCIVIGNKFFRCTSGSSLDSNTNGAVCVGNVLRRSGTITNSSTNSEVAHNTAV